jgi:hypothetical protein
MTKSIVRIHDLATNEIIDREMNNEELAQLAIDKVADDATKSEKAKLETDKAALLSKLGITADEAKLLLS